MGRRGPKPTPTAQLKLVGSRLPDRRRDEPQPEPGAPQQPKKLSDEAKAEWKRIVPELLRVGVLAKVDRAVLIGYCESWAMFTDAQQMVHDQGIIQTSKEGVDRPAAHVRVLNESRAAFLKFAQELGLSPSARVRLTSKVSPDADPLGAFTRKSRGG